MLLTVEQIKSHVVDAGRKQKLCCWCKICPKCNIDFSKFWHEFICVSLDISLFMDLFKLYMDLSKFWYGLSKMLYGFVEVVAWVCQGCNIDFSPSTKKTSWSLTNISKLVEASPLNKRCWLSQSIQCLGSVVPLAMFLYCQRISVQWSLWKKYHYSTIPNMPKFILQRVIELLTWSPL